MTEKNLKQIEAIALKFNNDADLIAKELKRIQSIKCRLKKQKQCLPMPLKSINMRVSIFTVIAPRVLISVL